MEGVAAAIQKTGCGACHVIPGIPNARGTIGPDLSQIGRVSEDRIGRDDYTGQASDVVEYIRESILEPDTYIAPECPGGPCLEGQMPASLAASLDEAELEGVVEYLASLLDETTATADTSELSDQTYEVPSLTEQEFTAATQIFFDRCAGCHGTLRNGATGPALTPDETLVKGTVALQAIISSGTPRGMPDFGRQGILSEAETELMAKFIQNDPPQPPEMSLQEMKDAWNVIIPVEDRPSAPEHDRNWQNFFAVTLRDAGQVAIIDGDTKEIVNIVDTGYAVHISRMSASGRYVFTIGRDGRAVLIDLWLEQPEKVAESRGCFDARSIEVSKYQGEQGDFFDKYAIIGCYWPPQFVILDGLTLEPITVVSTRGYTADTGEYHPEPRVASIVASEFKPQWIVNVKETGQVWLVDYTDPINPTIKMIKAEIFLHDGGWDSTGRYFLVAANQRDTIAVVDAMEEELVALVKTGKVPHPGRGANWVDPEYGPVWSTAHLGEGTLASIGTDPENFPDSAWRVVRSLELPGGGSLFLKTHPSSPWVWIDFALNADETLQRTVCVIAKENPSETYKCWEVADYGRAVHFEYNMNGDEVWVSVWGQADRPGQTGEIVIYDDQTLTEKTRIPDLITPTGKFNVYNTVNDIY
jgi:nitrite reductase (NO-forming)/hydroxylamine reductase